MKTSLLCVGTFADPGYVHEKILDSQHCAYYI